MTTIEHRFTSIVLAVALALSSFGCALHRLNKDLEKGREVSGAIQGYLETEEGVEGPFVVVLLQVTEDGYEPEEYMVIDRPGSYYLIAGEGRWRVVAFSDPEEDLIHHPGDAVHRPAPADDIVLDSSNRDRYGVSLNVAPAATALSGFPADLTAAGIPGRRFTSGLGNVVSLANRLFSPENGEMGLWEPYHFLEEVGFGLFLLDRLDPEKRQVIFVHGASGTPRDWTFITDRLDRDRIQPWLFYYPSGFPLATSARVLENVVREMSQTYGITEVDIVAHSMGGLLSRRAILDLTQSEAVPSVGQFITLSTPWQGNLGAKYGVDMSPAVIPSWRDMVPDSDFQKGILNQPFPDTIPYHLFFGFDSSAVMVGTSSDGTISLASMLDLRAQADAVRLYGYDVDHVGILNRGKVAAQLGLILLPKPEAHDPSEAAAP